MSHEKTTFLSVIPTHDLPEINSDICVWHSAGCVSQFQMVQWPIYNSIRLKDSVQWPFQETKLEVSTIYIKGLFSRLISRPM